MGVSSSVACLALLFLSVSFETFLGVFSTDFICSVNEFFDTGSEPFCLDDSFIGEGERELNDSCFFIIDLLLDEGRDGNFWGLWCECSDKDRLLLLTLGLNLDLLGVFGCSCLGLS